MSDGIDPAGVRAALAAALVLSGSLLGERLVIGAKVRAYFRVALPLGDEPLPLVRMPQAEAGSGTGILWSRSGDFVSWWVDPSRRGAPQGLHGNVRLTPGPRGVRVQVSWFPPWTPLIAALDPADPRRTDLVARLDAAG
jgi:hypothetical protein